MQEHQNVSADSVVRRDIHLRDYIAVLRKRRATVFTFLVITVLLVIVVSFSMTPMYTASTQVLIEENYGSGNIEGTYAYRRYDPAFLNTQFKIITSANVVERVVDNLKLDTKYKSYFIDEKNRLEVLAGSLKRKMTSLFSPTASTVSPDGNGQEDENFLDRKEEMSDRDAIVNAIREHLEIDPEKETRIVNIFYSHKVPALAKLIVEALIGAYKEELQEIKHSSSSDTLKWMTKKAEEERRKLEESELALQEYMRENDIITVENKLVIYPQKLSEFSSQLSTVQAERKKLESRYNQIKRALEESRDLETIPVFAENLVLQALREKIYAAEQNIKQLSKVYGYKNPVMIRAKEKLNSLQKERKAEVRRIIESTRNAYELAVSQEKNISDLLRATKNELLNLNEKFVQYSIMQREVNTNSILYDTLTASLKKASVTRQSQSVNVWVVKGARVPPYPSRPRKLLYVVTGMVFGLLGGVGLAFFLEYLDNTVETPEDIEKRFGLTVLGAIEELREKDLSIETFVKDEPLSPFAESYRLIRSSILLSSAGRPPRRILFTSMAPSEGKTSTTVNVARVLAQSDKKVLIIDCDMRRPRQHSLFAIPNTAGLSTYLTGNAGENIVQRVPGEELSLITAGPTPPNPAELLDSERMKGLLENMSEMFDFVLLDSPPVQSVTDSLTLSTLVDGTVLVVRAGVTTYDMVASGLRTLRTVNAHILGVVLNGTGRVTGGEGYYHGYYTYYSTDGRKET